MNDMDKLITRLVEELVEDLQRIENKVVDLHNSLDSYLYDVDNPPDREGGEE